MTPNLEEYILNHITPEPQELEEINREANLHMVNGRMCSGHLQGRLLKMLIEMIRPERGIELGTFAGYSALCMAEGMRESGKLITIEADDELEDIIKGNLAKSKYGERVELVIGDAMEVSSKYEDNSFDFAFMDADKRQYPQYYKEMKRIVKPGGYIIADNTLWDGHVLEQSPKSAQTKGIQEFNNLVAADKGVEAVILPLRDGITLIRLKTD